MYRDFPVLKPGLNTVSRFGNMTGILISLRRRTIKNPGKSCAFPGLKIFSRWFLIRFVIISRDRRR